jgi:hypothetical protein
MPSWEEVVSWVGVGSSAERIRDSSTGWQAVFNQLDNLQEDVNKLQKGVQREWAGSTSDALAGHLDKIASAVRGVIEGHRRIVVGLQEAATHLDAAQPNIRIPEWVKSEAEGRKATFHSSGQLTEYRTNEFYERMPWIDLGGYDPTGGEAELSANLGQRFWHWYNNYMETADKARKDLVGQYAKDATRIGTGAKVDSPKVAGAGGTKSGTGGATGSKDVGSGALNTGVSNPSIPTATPNMGSTPLSTAGLGSLPSNLASSGLSSPDLGSSGLAAASGLGSSGVDPSLGKLGGTGLAGLKPLGAGGIGAGGIGGLGAGLGPSVSAQEMVGETLGSLAAGGIAGGAGAAGLTGAGSSVMGMTPGGVAGAGAPSDTTGKTETKLIEDDKNIFGPRRSDQDLPGDVIG